ncbi:hypothetical protein CesoFtcFv8_002752 [Champsocephalus esox]|uniref:Uncharacterized protein n=1 Tax=Champsocephalus esox TaxID=159716 RepID=A0AAN8HHW7_9TELE|nr:hypothetical protein CesoFtcFv8_002752 [Champsocephalus esox]
MLIFRHIFSQPPRAWLHICPDWPARCHVLSRTPACPTSSTGGDWLLSSPAELCSPSALRATRLLCASLTDAPSVQM